VFPKHPMSGGAKGGCPGEAAARGQLHANPADPGIRFSQMKDQRRRHLGGRNLLLLIALVSLILVHPFVQAKWLSNLTLDIGLSMITLAGINAVADRRFAWIISAGIALPALAGRWIIHSLPQSKAVVVATLFCFSLFLLFNASCILAEVLQQRRVTANTIYGAVSVYIIIGVMFAGVFMAMETLQPGSFNLRTSDGNSVNAAQGQLTAFSFVTLTTVGYGDITPASAEARAICNVEAILGQMYLAVLVARLVGIQVSQGQQPDQP